MLREVIKLNSARRAHREGRFLDALELLEDPLIADHRKAQVLREKVLEALKKRGDVRRDAGQLTLALDDLAEVAERRPDDVAKGDGNAIRKMRIVRDEDEARVRALYFKARLKVEQGDLSAAELILSVVPDKARTPEFRSLCSEITQRQSDARSSIEDVIAGRIDSAQQDAVLNEAEKRWALCPLLVSARRHVSDCRIQRALAGRLSDGAFTAYLAEHGLYKARYLGSMDGADCAAMDASLNVEIKKRVNALLDEGRDEAARRILSRQHEYLTCSEADDVLRLGVDDLASARHLMDSGDYSGARTRVDCAVGRLGRRRAVRQLQKNIDESGRRCEELMQQARQAMNDGDLDQARDLIGALRGEYPSHVIARSLEEVIEEKLDARRVALTMVQESLGEGRIEAARRELLQLRLQGDRSPDISRLLSECTERERDSLVLPDGAGENEGSKGPLKRRRVSAVWMLSIEEAGEHLVFEQDEILIGNAIGGAADLPIMAPIATKHAVLRRRSSFHDGVVYSITVVDGHAMKINGCHETTVELSHEDLVQLGDGLSFQFLLPSTRSRAALIQLKHGLQVEGSRQILLMPPNGRGGALFVGGGGESHIKVAGGGEDEIEIFRESDSPLLQVRSSSGVAVDGQEARSQETVGINSFFHSDGISGAIRGVDL